MSSLRRFARLPTCFNRKTLKFASNLANRRVKQKSEGELQSSETSTYNKDLFPEKFLNKKFKTPDNLYIANEQAAEFIDRSVTPLLFKINSKTALEINPGPGYFTRKLLDREDEFRKIILVETLEYFMPKLNELHSLYPERVKVKHGDIIGLQRLAFQDRQDKGTRVSDLLEELPRNDINKDGDSSFVLFGAVGSYSFFKHLINSIVFQRSILSHGHCEMFLVVPPPIYVHLTCSNEIGYFIYRSTSILFQILFEYRFIKRMPREFFLPPQVKSNPAKYSKLLKLQSINPEYLYLVKIAPRRNLHKLCAPTDLPALWYFVKQNCISRRNTVISSLEKWVPGCGPRLIVNKKNRSPVKKLYRDEIVRNLPQFSKPCTTMSCNDHFPNINIYTQFGDLSPSQMLSLFKEFRSWPEYVESSFLASLESSLLKLETSNESIDLKEEDDEYIKEPQMEDPLENLIIKRKKKSASWK